MGRGGRDQEPGPSPWAAGGPSFLLLEGSGLTVSFTRRVLLLPEQRCTEASKFQNFSLYTAPLVKHHRVLRKHKL